MPAAPPVPRHHVLLATFAGGMVGTALRAGTGELLPHHAGQWPWSTLIVNVAGALLIGWLSLRLPRTIDLDPRLHPFLATGLCGGLTTFSAMQFDTLGMSSAAGMGYLVLSVALGLIAIAIGRALAGAGNDPTGAEQAA